MDSFQRDLTAALPRLRAFARALAAGDTALADDLVQDTCLRALRARASFCAGTNFEAWLFTILKNRQRSLARQRTSRPIATLDGEEGREVAVAGRQEDRLALLAFEAAFAHLDVADRAALSLHVAHGWSHAAIAELWGCRVGTVKSRISRARRRLRRELNPERGEVAPGTNASSTVADRPC